MVHNAEIEFRKEIWMWRGVTILLVLILLITTAVTYFKDREQHAVDNTERAQAWQKILSNQDQLKGMIGLNYSTVVQVDNSLQRCMGCHSYTTKPKGIK
jgi:predicted negative regulator of RcsB-dependent stress response